MAMSLGLLSHHPRGARRPRGFTLIEVLVALTVLGVIMVPLTAAFINSIRTTNDVQTSIGAAADSQRIASWWTKDVHNVDANGVNTAGECPAPAGSQPTVVEQPLITFTWDTSTSALDYDPDLGSYRVIPKKATWVVEGNGYNAELVRRYCEDDAPVSETFVAGSFWKYDYDAASLIHGLMGYGSKEYCANDGRTCTINVTGNYTYSLTVDRRVIGVAPPALTTPPPPACTGGIGGNGSITVAWLP